MLNFVPNTAIGSISLHLNNKHAIILGNKYIDIISCPQIKYYLQIDT